MQSDPARRKPSAALLIFLAVYIAAFGLLLMPKGSFVSGPATALLTTP